jgi:hypothetical protein
MVETEYKDRDGIRLYEHDIISFTYHVGVHRYGRIERCDTVLNVVDSDGIYLMDLKSCVEMYNCEVVR